MNISNALYVIMQIMHNYYKFKYTISMYIYVQKVVKNNKISLVTLFLCKYIWKLIHKVVYLQT